MDEDNIYDHLKDILANTGGKFNILEEQINVELQVEFFELVNKLMKNKREDAEVISDETKLYESEISDDEKKRILAELSNTENVESYRIIEKFIKSNHKELNQWAILSLQHSRISLETHLLDEQQVFISTGLGGRNSKLRYFIVGKLKTNETITDTQKRVIKTEFEISFKTFHSVLEKLSFKNEYFIILALIPFEVSIGEVIKNAIDESNQYGDFIHEKYLVTNVRILEITEIEKYFKNFGI